MVRYGVQTIQVTSNQCQTVTVNKNTANNIPATNFTEPITTILQNITSAELCNSPVRRNASPNLAGPIVGQSNDQPSKHPNERSRQVTWQKYTRIIDAHALQSPQRIHSVKLTEADAHKVQPHMETSFVNEVTVVTETTIVTLTP